MKKILIILLIIIIIIAASFYGFTKYNENKLLALGYTKDEIDQLVDEHGYNLVETVENNLETEIKDKELVVTTEIGMPLEFLEGYDTLSRVKYNVALDSYIEEHTVKYNEYIEEINEELLALQIEEDAVEDLSLHDTLLAKDAILRKHIENYNNELQNKQDTLLNMGVSLEEVSSYLTGDILVDINKLNERVEYYTNFSQLVGSYGNTFASGGMDLFNILNNHRVASGFSPWTYNHDQQSCVDIEANSYATNKNPHNWLCKTLTSEGASLANINSDYVGIAGHFLTTDPSHEADVINPNYTSAACSIVTNGNMNYMICGYFR